MIATDDLDGITGRGARVAPHWVARLQGYGALLILDDERVLSTPSFGCARR